ncbi:MAG: hypothetical protein M3069_15790, partial [Chloroflexota bacterium]|nr:hypothetical protein [Chloroflexota bacterium]
RDLAEHAGWIGRGGDRVVPRLGERMTPSKQSQGSESKMGEQFLQPVFRVQRKHRWSFHI